MIGQEYPAFSKHCSSFKRKSVSYLFMAISKLSRSMLVHKFTMFATLIQTRLVSSQVCKYSFMNHVFVMLIRFEKIVLTFLHCLKLHICVCIFSCTCKICVDSFKLIMIYMVTQDWELSCWEKTQVYNIPK